MRPDWCAPVPAADDEALAPEPVDDDWPPVGPHVADPEMGEGGAPAGWAVNGLSPRRGAANSWSKRRAILET